MTGAPDPQASAAQDVEKRIVVGPEDVTMPGERDATLRQHVIAAITFSALLVAAFLGFVAVLFAINALVGH